MKGDSFEKLAVNHIMANSPPVTWVWHVTVGHVGVACDSWFISCYCHLSSSLHWLMVNINIHEVAAADLICILVVCSILTLNKQDGLL